jgi:hypothetical protein
MFWNRFIRYPGDFSFKDSVLSSCFSFVVEYALPFVLGSFISAVGRLVSFFLSHRPVFVLSSPTVQFLPPYYSVFIVLHTSLFLFCLTAQRCFISFFRFCPPAPAVAARSKAWGDCGFESHEGHGCLSVVSVVCCQGWDLCVGPITRPEESYRLWRDREASIMRGPWPTGGCCSMRAKNRLTFPYKSNGRANILLTSLNPVRFQLKYLCVLWRDVERRLHEF